MPRRMIFNAFSMFSVSHIYHGLWRHPQSRQRAFNDLQTWIELAQLLERGRFDALFLADVIGTDSIYKGNWDIYLNEAVQIPINDPSVLAAALIGATEHLGLAVTSSILQDHPFNFARRMSTFDHLSKGRIGWNIVTSVSNNASQNFGLPAITAHDERYRWAEEYVDVAYKLWEGSWEDDAVVDDPEANVYADPRKVHRIHHEGARYRVAGPHLVAPSPQRTPVLYQAGASRSGRDFAAAHAEGTFIMAGSPDGARILTRDVRRRMAALGRQPDDLLFLQGLSFVVGSTEEEARRKAREHDAYLSVDGLLAHISRDLGIDLGRVDLDEPLDGLKVQGVQSLIDNFRESTGQQAVTARDLAHSYAMRTRIIGTPAQIADELERWRDAGVDGVNVMYEITPGSFADFIDHVMPELRRRGLAQAEYASGTLREKLFAGRGPGVNARHPAHARKRVGGGGSAGST